MDTGTKLDFSKEYVIGDALAMRMHYSRIMGLRLRPLLQSGDMVTFSYEEKTLYVPIEDIFDVDSPEGILLMGRYPVITTAVYGKGFLYQGNQVRVMGRRSVEGFYQDLVGQIVTIKGPYAPKDSTSVDVYSEKLGGWWVYSNDVVPLFTDNEDYLTTLREVPVDERHLPRII